MKVSETPKRRQSEYGEQKVAEHDGGRRQIISVDLTFSLRNQI